MRISISGKHMETGEALKTHVTEHLTTAVGKYFKDAINAQAIFSKRGNFFECEIIVNEGIKNGLAITAKDESDDVYGAFDSALAKAEKQLRRHKRKLKDRGTKIGLPELSAMQMQAATA
jgi:ribosomal subunit interface protein